MEQLFTKAGILNGTTLKLIAVISMTIDHIGYIFFPHYAWLRILGRLAFPIFAYMIAEGCYYTKNPRKYLCMVFGIGILCQAALRIVERSWNLNIMFSLGLSIVLIFLLRWARGSRDIIGGESAGRQESGSKNHFVRWFIFVLALAAVAFLDYGLSALVRGFSLEYGFFGVTLAVVIYIMPKKYQKILITAVWLVLLCALRYNPWSVQWWCLFALIPLILYNGKPGKHRMKYFFYLYYPIHLGILWGIYFLR